MASSAVLSFLFILVLFSSPQIQGRESKFFSKVTHNSSPTEAAKEPSSEFPDTPVYAPTPAPAPGPASELFQSDTLDGYGLYGRGSKEFSPTTVSENEVVPEELTDESYKELAETSYTNNNNRYSTEYYKNNGHTTEQQGMSDTRFLENGKYSYTPNTYSTNSNKNGYSSSYRNNGYSTSSSNNNGYSTEKQGMSDTRFLENGKYSYTPDTYSTNSNKNGYSSSYRNNGYSTSSSRNNGYSTEKQGMSDTRFLENGKYHYDPNNENHYVDGYNTEKGSTSNEFYYSNTENSNEFNSMEEYQRQQEEYQQGQEEYVP
ncbi:hypothetical protein PVL29_015245 [Vitis rotundifolia]|uniref:Protein E6-like n=1 Tax=Vitis rotundifolia TaxID=103349 RepID=A0AA38ZD02_VITRO|nr:hypothetical protein PVL29_015245 [Vitis rotundifolia]